NIELSYALFLFNLFGINEIALIALEDADKRSAKYIPSDLDKKFTPKLFKNNLVQSIDKNDKTNKAFAKHHFKERTDKDIFRKIYFDFAKDPAYEAYILSPDTDEKHLEILLELYRFCRKNEHFNEMLEDQFVNWEDEKSLVVGAVKKAIKALPSDTAAYLKESYPDDETIKEFGESLFIRTFEEDSSLLDIIKPTLKNWDSDRVAIIDMILLKMAISEFLYFESIPTKVTLNEYVELSKTYSTPKSKEFINGVLDKLMKDLDEKGLVKKSGRGLVD